MRTRRRDFFQRAAGGLALAGAGCAEPPSAPEPVELGGYALDELRTLYHADLFDDFLPFLEQHVIDHELGGFMCHTDRSGRNITKTKTTWYEGRGIWVYSFLYNHLEARPEHLEVARKSVEFILPQMPTDGSLWPGSFTREGEVNNDRAPDIYGGLFVANGLAEFSKAAGDAKYWDLAKEILESHLSIYDSPAYAYHVTYGPDDPPFSGPRVLGHWMVLLRLATQMLETRQDAFVESVADRSVEAIVDRHLHPEFQLLNEVLRHDLSRASGGWEQFCYTGHAIETLWMVMFEAKRREDRELYERAAAMFKRHVEIAWDDVYGGFFRSLDHVGDHRWKTDKVLWLQEEVLIGTLFMIEHTGDEWARRWFEKTYRYVREKFPLKPYGYSLWNMGADRRVTFVEEASRVGNFHHPRHLMLNMLALDRLRRRATSGRHRAATEMERAPALAGGTLRPEHVAG